MTYKIMAPELLLYCNDRLLG